MSKRNAWYFLIVLAAILVVAQGYTDALRYDRALIWQGEIWRLISGHFCHLNGLNLGLNLAAAVFLAYLFGDLHSIGWWIMAGLVIAVSICVGLLMFCPDIEWYVGLSGILHGILVIGLLDRIVEGQRIYLLVVPLLIIKLVVEQAGHPLGYFNEVIAGNVVVQSHLIGTVCGLVLFSGSYWLSRKNFNPVVEPK